MRATLFFIFSLVAGVVFSQNRLMPSSASKATLDQTAQYEHVGSPVCGTSMITEEEIQKAVANTRLFKPEVYALMEKVKLESSALGIAADNIGDKRTFFVPNSETQTFDNITAELRAQGTLVQVWVDTTELGNQHVTQIEIDAMFQALENQTPPTSRDPQKGIVRLDNEFFGNPPNLDGDGITDFLVVDIKDGWQPGRSFFTAGFFFSNDQLVSNPGSNRRDMLYIDSYPTIFLNGRRDVDLVLSVLAHEYQHLIHYNFDRDEHGFVNEGLSELAMILCGYEPESPSLYFGNTDVPLFVWNGLVADYSRTALFMLYLNEQFGDGIIKPLVQDPGNNEQGLRNVFSIRGVDLTQVIENWFIANYLNDHNLDSRFGYVYPIGSTPKPAQNHSDPNQNKQGETVEGYAVDYIAFGFGDSLRANFSGAPLTLKAIKLGPGLKQLVDVPLGTFYSVPEFGATVNTVVFVLINKNLAQTTYSYVSQGKQKGVLVEQTYDDGTPDRFSGTANFLGFGNDSKRFGWAVKFTPEIPTNQLTAAKILAVFDQEFSGSTTPANAPKDFLFHVWNDNNGLPGSDLITPFIFSTNRVSTDGRTFLTIDLAPYAAALKNVGTVYIGFTEDDDDTVGTSVGMDNSLGTSHTYAFFGPTHPTRPNQWIPMANLSVGQVPLATWNMMMRASFVYSDPTTPRFAVGYFQNPIFSERLDVFAVAKSALNRTNLSGTLTLGASTNTLSFAPVPNAGDQVFVDNNVTLTASGAVQIRVRGTTKYGLLYNDTTFTFNVQFLQSANGGVIAATDGRIEVDIPQHALAGDMYLIASAGNAEVLNAEIESSLPNKLSEIYTVSPLDYKLAKPAQMKIYLDRRRLGTVAPKDVAIAYWDSKKWVMLNSTLAGSGDYIAAEISQLGRFVLAPKDNLTAIDTAPTEIIPSRFALHQNYPNPFNPSANIRFDLPEKAFVVLKIYDVYGREVRALVNESKAAGSFLATWEGTDGSGNKVVSGIYFYRIVAGDFTQTMKMVLTK